MPDFEKMKAECKELRNTIIDMIHNAGSGHSGGSLSAVELLWTLYSQVMNIGPDKIEDPKRDRFILSKGHAAPILYATLAKLGIIEPASLDTLRKTGSILQGHPDMHKTPGVEMSTGSLGMGISVGIGMALGARLSGNDYKTFILVGDGELQEGQNWEGFMSANKFKLKDLIVIVDMNGVQLDGTTDEVMPMLDVVKKISSFGFDVTTCDGHSCEEVYNAYKWALDGGDTGDSPKAIVAKTVKGKGVSFMEGKSSWHGAPITDELYEAAKKELK